ncbi:AAA family ATPase [Acinetobacter higginsii]|uniref:AAA family ATPase n=1 Tax=Acinetobacter higginsii TaxID=70347 RepID=UPI001F4B2178|nr:AAA family ATPase [Acinetobacter higginsii]MCH7340759.1 AAA family ATPase [Acinetobacter higginsii]
MIKKIKSIGNLAVFKGFEWDSNVRNNGGAADTFKDINIIYGRNYSGKTSLSRIIRALEMGRISDKYNNPEFCVKFSDKEVTQNNLTSHGKKIRVFNEDFIKENLKFIVHQDDGIQSFAILGENNNIVETEIQTIEDELGKKEQGQETGLYAKRVQVISSYDDAKIVWDNAKRALDKQLSDKATDRKNGIKYQSERFGDQNYNVQKLSNDIREVLSESYKELSLEEIEQFRKLSLEKALDEFSIIELPKIRLSNFVEKTEKLVAKKISSSNKIEELVKNAILNRWVNEGRSYHKDKLSNCAFCGTLISEERWKELDRHFDKESKILEDDIDSLIVDIESEKKSFSLLKVDKSKFYSKFHKTLDIIQTDLEGIIGKYDLILDSLIDQLKERKANILTEKDFINPNKDVEDLKVIWTSYLNIKKESTEFSKQLLNEQKHAKDKLRLNEISNFLEIIKYQDQVANIKALSIKVVENENKKISIDEIISQKEQLIKTKKAELRDEEKGADKVNELLKNFFGHHYLSLQPITNKSGVRFEVIRDDKKAYHLSEGECSLLAFCYFMAKLEDIDTKGSKPIIWIDDPISSLDSNHIFFIYSLINEKIVNNHIFGQLFISTHNLDFLKYLRKVDGKFLNASGKHQNYQKEYFLISRVNDTSKISIMPKYLKEYVTEFNYLFHQIYKCSVIEVIDDSNYITFYNFGNNARKFFEIYLYYKYPDKGMTEETLNLFFDGDNIPALLTDRINNEYSHLCGVFERGSSPVEVPEMQIAAKRIITKLSADREQFIGLLKSVGEDTSNISSASEV